MVTNTGNGIMIFLMAFFLIAETIKLVANLKGKKTFSFVYKIVLFFMRRTRGRAFYDAHIKKLMDVYDLKKEIRDSMITIGVILLFLIVPVTSVLKGIQQ